MNLVDIGWNDHFCSHFDSLGIPGLTPARVSRQDRGRYLVMCELGELTGELAGKVRHSADTGGHLPAVGDWVAVKVYLKERKATIRALLPRKSAFIRKVAGIKTEEQVIGANIDNVFIVCGLDANYNLRRIERYLSLAWKSGAAPVVVLNKSDLCHDVKARLREVESIAIGVPVLALSARANTGIDDLRRYLVNGKTASFIGSSGVGKSTLINTLLGFEQLFTKPVREKDSRGRHATASRQMIILPPYRSAGSGGIVIDTPGMRELQMWGDESGVEETFDDIEELAANCRFRDCGHVSEPGCAVRQAVEDGTLLEARFRSYLKLKKELKNLAYRQKGKAILERKKEDKRLSKAIKRFKKGK